MMDANYNISKSFLLSYLDYCHGKECGIKWSEINLFKTIKQEPTDAMMLGKYFEYKATGYVGAGEEEPRPKTKRDGNLTAEYERAEIQAMNFKKYCTNLGIEILEIGKRIVKDNCSLVLDIVAMYKGREVIIDLKYTGKLYDKWDDNGWSLDSFEYKTAHHIQPIHYSYMTGMPFYYFVFSSTNEDCEFFEVKMEQPITNEIHQQRLESVRKRIDMEIVTGGFIARPTLKRCSNCPLNDSCSYASKSPEEKSVYIQPTYDNILDQ